MWILKDIAREITQGVIYKRLQAQTQEQIKKIPQDDLLESISFLLERPQPTNIPHSRVLSNLTLAAEYYEVFKVLKLPEKLSVFEPCIGSSEPVILAADAYSHGKANYLGINLNNPLREELRGKIEHLGLSLRIIDDNAQNVLSYFEPNSVNISCFHHAINDILQTASAEPRGMDTTKVDWWSNERQMIEWLAEDFVSAIVEERGKKALIEIISNAIELTHSGGYLVFDHWTSLTHKAMDWFPWELFCDLVPIARRWIEESKLPVVEINLPDVNPQWWMFLRVEK
jgi:hypothetical protein